MAVFYFRLFLKDFYLCSDEMETSHIAFRRVCGFVFLHKDKCSIA